MSKKAAIVFQPVGLFLSRPRQSQISEDQQFWAKPEESSKRDAIIIQPEEIDSIFTCVQDNQGVVMSKNP